MEIAGRAHQLTRNDGPHHLHGGKSGFNARVWQAATEWRADTAAVEFFRTSNDNDGEEGYPGSLQARVRYELRLGGSLTIRYDAIGDATTIINLTQHTYCNLAGKGDILEHELTIAADHYTPVDGQLIPTRAIASVAGSPFDFRVPSAVGARIDEPDGQLRRGRGYDHNFAFRRLTPGTVISLHDPRTGRTLDISTSEPGVRSTRETCCRCREPVYASRRSTSQTRPIMARSRPPSLLRARDTDRPHAGVLASADEPRWSHACNDQMRTHTC